MPTVNLNLQVVEKLLGKKVPLEKLKDRIFMLGTDLKSITDKEITVEIFPNRPDLLSEQGFARALSSFLNIKTGIKKYNVKKSGYSCKVEKTLDPWPYTVNAIVKNLKFDNERIREIMQLQEKLGTTLTRNRRKGGIGIYPLDKIKFPIKFTTMKLKDIKFRPLESNKEMNGLEIINEHPTGKKYGYILAKEKEQPVFVDSNNNIMSIPPIINSHDTGRINESTKDVFIECSGPDLNTLNAALNIIVTSLADMKGEIYSLDIIYKNKKLVTPNLEPFLMDLDIKYVNKILDLNLKESEVKKYLQMMGLDYINRKAIIPSYRVDILHQIDLIEEIAIAYGYENFDSKLSNFGSVAEEDKLEIFKKKIANILTSLNFIEISTFNLTSIERNNKKMNVNDEFVKLDNSINEEFTILRSWLLPSLLEALSNNKHNDLPQKIFEISKVFSKNKETEKLSIVICNSKTNFTEIKQILDSLFLNLGLTYEIKSTKHDSFIEGRCGLISIKGKELGIIGEIFPSVLNNWQLENPAVALELDLQELFIKIK
ncbi:MAG TPA: phenylalanine--tRNA ligase subunit beta [Candidatus Nanoarchaeia archaeon]|nr:phenylalanine--tRNA ligase subunit beta [Candidatus Nanoarchaeia archaeon]